MEGHLTAESWPRLKEGELIRYLIGWGGGEDGAPHMSVALKVREVRDGGREGRVEWPDTKRLEWLSHSRCAEYRPIGVGPRGARRAYPEMGEAAWKAVWR